MWPSSWRTGVPALILCPFLCVAAAQTPAGQQSPVLVDTAPAPSAQFPAAWYPAASDTIYTELIERGHPYTGTLRTTGKSRNPVSGETLDTVEITAQMRDGQGRRREEVLTHRPDGQGGTAEVREISVSDPVSHCNFQWMEPWVASGPEQGQPVATVSCKPLVEHYTLQNIWRGNMVSEREETRDADSSYVSEPLGERTLGGLQAVGTRRTTTRLDASGNSTGAVVMEQWYSPEIEELLRATFTTGDATVAPGYQLTKLKLEEPSPAEFYPPAGYDIRATPQAGQ